MEGVDLDLVARKFGPEARVRLMENSGQYLLKRRIEKVENRLVLTDEGRLFADGIAADLFFELLKESPHSS
jgi:oxygen-independent coproporphyrinogen-3 oxidase